MFQSRISSGQILKRSILLMIVFAANLALCSRAWPVVMAFMPGDAFFHAKLTEDVVATLPNAGGSIVLTYSYVPLTGGFGGNAGFECLRLEGVSQATSESLRNVYRRFRAHDPKLVMIRIDDDGNPESTEVNGFHIFVYNRDVDWLKQRLAIKYNEDWLHLPPEALTGPRRGPGNPLKFYDSFVRTYDAVVHDWKNASRFDRLKVDVPKDVAWGVAGRKITAEVVADMDDVQILVLFYDELRPYFRQSPKYEFLSITSKEVKEVRWRGGEVVIKEWEAQPKQD